MAFQTGDFVKLKGMGDALWRIEELGTQEFYSSGQPSCEEGTFVSLHLPEPQLPRSAYPTTTWTHRKFMVEVPPMLVLAYEARSKRRSRAAELLIEQRYKRRVRRLRELERVGGPALDAFKQSNRDLFYEQETFSVEWSNFPMESAR